MIRSAVLQLDVLEGGAIIKAMDDALSRAAHDVVTRHYVKKPRKVTLEVTIAPQTSGDGKSFRNNPLIEAAIKVAVPGTTGIGTTAFVENGMVMINVDDAENPGQGHLFPSRPSDDEPEPAPANVTSLRS